MRKLFKIVLSTVGVLLVLLVLLAGLTQTQFFRDRLRSAVLSNLDSLLIAEVYLGPIRGNLVTGFSIDGVAISDGGIPIVAAERIDLRYNLWGLPTKSLSVRTLTLVNPTVRLVKGTDSVWNISRIVRPQPADSTPSTPFDWELSVDQLELENGTFAMTDSTALLEVPPLSAAERRLNDFTADSLNLLLAARITKTEKSVDIRRLAFRSDALGLTLKRLSGSFAITRTEARVENLVISTGGSEVSLHAAMLDVNLLRGVQLERLRHVPVDVDLQANPIDLNELGRLLPPVDFLNGRAYLVLNTEGQFGDLGVRQLDLMTGQTRLSFKGKVSNLHAPDDLVLDLRMTDAKIQPRDVVTLMPPFELPDFSAMGPVTLNMEYAGRPLDFKTKILLETPSGSVNGNVAMRIGGPKTLKYNGEFTVAKLNLAALLEDEQFASSVNGTVQIEGEGVELAELASTLKAQLGPSEFRGLTLAAPDVRVAAAGKVVRGNAEISLGDMRSTLVAELDDRTPKAPRFAVGANVQSLNLAPLLRDEAYNSDLNLRLETHGTGLSWSRLEGELLLDLSSSRYKDYRFPAGDVQVLLRQSDPRHKELSLTSHNLDFSLTGSFDLEHLARLLSYEVANIRGDIGERLASLDSSLAVPKSNGTFAAAGKWLAASPALVDAEYMVQIKDLEPIAVVAGQRTFNGTGTLNGSIKGNYSSLAVHGLFDVRDFYYGNVQSGVLLQNSTIAFDLTSLTPTRALANLGLQLTVDAQQVHINDLVLDTVRMDFTYESERARYSARGTADTVIRVSVGGDAAFAQAGATATLARLRASYGDLLWNADSGAVVHYARQGLNVAGLVMRRDTQEVALSGRLGPGDMLGLDMQARRVSLDNLKYLMGEGALRDSRQTFGGTADIAFTAGGTFRQPVYTASLHARDISFRGIPFGGLQGDFNYQDEQLEIELDGGPPQVDRATAGLVVSGTLPLNLALEGGDGEVSERPMNLSVQSTGVQMSILDPLVPTFNDLSGIMRCNLTVGGTLEHPDYRGSISFHECSFYFVPNDIRYTMEAAFEPAGERIRVKDLVIRNVPEDNRGGREGVMRLEGDFQLADFEPGDFNLTATGQLLLVKETSRFSALSLYGNLFVEIGRSGLHFTGEIEQSLLKGAVVISNSNLIFPPSQQSTGEFESLASIPVILVDDTAEVTVPEVSPSLVHYFNGENGKQRVSGGEEDDGRSFLDGVRYDLDVETAGGNTQIRMVFNSTTNEELVATLEGKFRVTGDGRQWFGDLDVNRAYYNFFKRFDASGSIRFVGDLLNPELDIAARYQGSRAIGDSLEESVVVIFKITGPRLEPKIDISMEIAGEDYYGYASSGRGPTSHDVQTDAIQFVVYGSFPLTSTQRANARADIGSTVGSSLATGATSLVTGALSEFLRNQTGFISSVELSYGAGGSLAESADIRLSGVAWHGYWRYGGKILEDPLSSANFSILYSFGSIFGDPSLRNLMLELERKVETNTFGPSNDLKRVNSARLFYRFSF